MNISILLIFVGVIFFLLLALLAIKLGMSDTSDKENRPSELQPAIHTSGIYSIVRKSPRENIYAAKVSKKDIEQYLKAQTVNSLGEKISEDNKVILSEMWNKSIEESIKIIENGDKNGVEFYFFKTDKKGHNCLDHFPHGSYVTREEIHKYPELLPPFHIGCTLKLEPHTQGSDFSDTTTISMKPLVNNGVLPLLPDWKEIK